LKVTIKDIARIAGVSHSTVSRSLNDHPSISLERREQIKKIAQELGFQYNASAKQLRGGKIGTVGIITTRQRQASFFLDSLIGKITFGEQNSFLDYIVAEPSSSHGGNNIKRLMSSGKVDGFIFIHSEIHYADYEFLSQQNIPFVLLHWRPKNFTYDNLNYFFTDHEHGAYLATTHLLDLGLKNILCITEGGGELQFLERINGYRKALKEKDLPFDPAMLVEGEVSYEYGKQVVRQHRGILHRIDAIFAQADIVALGVIKALQEEGIRVPEDISVVGYDDIQMGEFSNPRLTTIHQPTEDMDHQACLRINDLINGTNTDKPVQKVFLPGLVIRDSCLKA